jgi:hypothetical protein
MLMLAALVALSIIPGFTFSIITNFGYTDATFRGLVRSRGLFLWGGAGAIGGFFALGVAAVAFQLFL